ncbi:MAG: tRNA dihydrouridine synthase DusB [Alphaproteobacteria bacterium]|nr:tRNA dihydrouridine synthase DusB [Alphaproteobacteria bacterium]
MTISIGPITLAAPVILAPMSGVTDLPFRRLVRRFGVGLTVSEMIASQAMIRQTRQSRQRAAIDRADAPVSVQIAGCDPQVMAEAAKLNEDLGADVIDINMGCPVKKVVGGHAGSALMRDEALAARLIEATVKAVKVPVTLKMRTGWDITSRNAPRLARIAEDLGIRLVTVHGRTRNQLYTGRADWDFIAEVKQAVRIPVIANGDVVTLDDASEILARSRADGVMIGRGAYGRPWFPSQVMRFLADGTRLADPTPGERGHILIGHHRAMIEHYGAPVGLRVARKHVGWYTRGLYGAALFRAEVNRLDDPGAVEARIAEFFARATDGAPVASDHQEEAA